MRVLFLNYEYPPLGGGAGKASRCLLEEFAANYPDMRVDAVVSSESKRQELFIGQSVCIQKLDINKRGNIHYQSSRELICYMRKAYQSTKEMLKLQNYDLIHCFFAVPTGIIAYLHRKRIPYIISLRGSDVPYYNERFKLLYPFLTPAIKMVCSKAAHVVANSNGLRDLAQKHLSNPIGVIPNGVNPVPGIAMKRRNPGPFRALYVGRLIRRKGVDFLLRGFAQFLQNTPDAKLDIVGTGNLHSELLLLSKALGISHSVTFHGELSGIELDSIYRQATIFVLPSFNEGMSNSLLEAESYGLPVIITNTGGTEELFADNGFCINKAAPAEIAQAFCKFAQKPEILQKMRENSLGISGKYTWNRVAEAYASLYRQIPHV